MNRSFCPAVLVAQLFVIGSASTAQQPTSDRPKGRVFAKGAWIETGRITDDGGRVLTNPRLLAARGDDVYVYDGGTQELIAFTRAGRGRAVWRAGRAGKGPSEFSNPVDLQVAPNGDIHVLDSDVSRITIVDPGGHVVDMRTIAEPLHRIVPRRAGWWGAPLARPHILVPVTADGKPGVQDSDPTPADISKRHILVREPHVAPRPNGGAIVGFVWSSRLLVIDPDGKLVADLEGPEHIPFAELRSYTIEIPQKATVQRIDPKAHVGSRYVAVNDTMALVLFGGTTRDRGKIVDRFDLRARRYVDSAKLPRQPAALRIVGNSLVALELDPAPAIVFYEWRK